MGPRDKPEGDGVREQWRLCFADNMVPVMKALRGLDMGRG